MSGLVTILNVPLTGYTAPSESADRRPLILWQNLLADDSATITASSELPAYPAISVMDGKEYTYWKSAAGGTQSIQADFLSAQNVNACAIHGHNLHLISGTVSLQRWNGSIWETLGTATPATSAPVIIIAAATSGTRYRVQFVATNAASCAVVYIGQSMTMERGCWEGFTPPWMGRDTRVATTRSESGALLGRSVTLVGVEFSMDFSHLLIAFVRSQWMPFIVSAESNPFFVAWNLSEYPDEAAFCWVNDPSRDIQSPRMVGPDHMSAGIKVSGRVEGMAS